MRLELGRNVHLRPGRRHFTALAWLEQESYGAFAEQDTARSANIENVPGPVRR
jgi:hypothetical protein